MGLTTPNSSCLTTGRAPLISPSSRFTRRHNVVAFMKGDNSRPSSMNRPHPIPLREWLMAEVVPALVDKTRSPRVLSVLARLHIRDFASAIRQRLVPSLNHQVEFAGSIPTRPVDGHCADNLSLSLLTVDVVEVDGVLRTFPRGSARSRFRWRCSRRSVRLRCLLWIQPGGRGCDRPNV